MEGVGSSSLTIVEKRSIEAVTISSTIDTMPTVYDMQIVRVMLH